ncbi:hypothetical protein H9P43_006540 [Blastocladiella emersonii ATCC 22665]|nr:hypothetical protein H9P43_006540 [Blastocladiella emersonii ATCC 22665]
MKLDATDPEAASDRHLPVELWERVVHFVVKRGRAGSNESVDPWRWDLLHLGNLCRTTYAITRPYLFRELVLGFRANVAKHRLPAWNRTADVHPLTNMRRIVDTTTSDLMQHVRPLSEIPELCPYVVRTAGIASLWSSFIDKAALANLCAACEIKGGLVLTPFPLSLVSALTIVDYNGTSFDLREIVGGRKWKRLPFLAALDPARIQKLEFRSESKSALRMVPEYRGHRARAVIQSMDLVQLSRRCPKLERLILPTVYTYMRVVKEGGLIFPCLREMDVTASVCSGLGRTTLPELHKLTVRGSPDEIGAELWPKLEVLRVEADSVSDEVREQIASLPGLKSFKVAEVL